MRIRVMSDLHLDVNQKFPFSLREDERNDFTLLAGDVSGNVKLTAKWVKTNIKRGMLVCGNHDPSYNELGWTVQRQKGFLAEKFPLTNDVTFLDEQVGVMSKMIPDTDILVIGSTLYTDYKYINDSNMRILEGRNKENAQNGEPILEIEEINKCAGWRGLNDFRWGHVPDEIEGGEKQRHLRPDDYKQWFDVTFKKIGELVESNSDKDVIVLTHHCPTPLCISSEYVSGNMNASYVSDLSEFIKGHKNIRAWCCGHVHNRTFANVHDTLVVCNPRGYERSFECMDWSPNTFINTDTWKVEVDEYKNPKLDKAREDARNNFLKYAGLFI